MAPVSCQQAWLCFAALILCPHALRSRLHSQLQHTRLCMGVYGFTVGLARAAVCLWLLFMHACLGHWEGMGVCYIVSFTIQSDTKILLRGLCARKNKIKDTDGAECVLHRLQCASSWPCPTRHTSQGAMSDRPSLQLSSSACRASKS